MDRPIVNLADLEYRTIGRAAPGSDPDPRYAARLGPVSARVGARLLGYNVTVLPPGKAAFPRHSHHVNEEMFLVLSGSGTVRIGEASHAIAEGDVIACPPGGPETAHQIVNTSATEELRFLAVSTLMSPEIAEYPDSGKFGIYADRPSGPRSGAPVERMRYLSRQERSLDYWEGE